MNPPPGPAVFALVALLLLALAFCVLGAFTVVILIRRFIIIPKFRKDFLALHTRRVARARLALAGDADNGDDADSGPSLTVHAHAFSGWVDLGQDGAVTIAGQSFRPNEVFEVIARDANNLPRAKAVGNGKGEVLIASHGQTFRAIFTGAEWDVQLLESDQP
jgi:hypothetical protein